MKLSNIVRQQDESGKSLAVSVEFLGEENERRKWLHDLSAAVEAFHLLIEICEEDKPSPTDRERKKFQQLKNHEEKLREGINILRQITHTTTKEGI